MTSYWVKLRYSEATSGNALKMIKPTSHGMM